MGPQLVVFLCVVPQSELVDNLPDVNRGWSTTSQGGSVVEIRLAKG